LSTGTNPPGNIIFDPLYGLPYGWLLREPGRFLMVAALGYSLLIAAVIDVAVESQFLAELQSRSHVAAASLRMSWLALRLSFPKRRRLVSAIGLSEPALRLTRSALPLVITAVSIACVVSLGFPMYTGAVVPDNRPLLPPAHVSMPAYWQEMARYVDGIPRQGGVLIMPPDDYYAMPTAS